MPTKAKTMHDLPTYGLIGMLIILSASLLPTNAEDPQASEEYYPDDYDYDNDTMPVNASANTQSQASSPKSSPPLISMATLMSLPNKFEIPSRTNYVQEPVCPPVCQCFDDFKSIDCSGRQLTELPKDLPRSVHTLNLSMNKIDALPDHAFRNLRKLQKINLSHNRLRTLSKEVFTELTSLESLHLENNAFDHIPADAFSNAVNLKELHLSNNALSQGPQQLNSSFLDHTNLLQLHCNNCSWLSLPDSIFANLTGLEILMLDENPFKEINIRAFAPLENLIKLALPTAQESSLTELCQLLKSIDNISFDNYTLSCYELVLGTAFNDSIKITRHETDRQTELKMNVTASWYNSTIDPTNATNTLVINAGNDTDISTVTGKSTTTTGDDESTYQVPVSQEVINIMLISIMIIAVIGILIGIVCRKDVCGIKTKCCRTKKPKPEDPQQPAEEILLNKLA